MKLTDVLPRRYGRWLLLIVFILGISGAGMWAVIRYDRNAEETLQNRMVMDAATKAYNDCVKEGGRVMESYPPVCQSQDGRQFRPTVK